MKQSLTEKQNGGCLQEVVTMRELTVVTYMYIHVTCKICRALCLIFYLIYMEHFTQ